LELRTVVIDGEIPIVIRRWRQASNWHANSTHAETLRTEDAYSPAEVAQLMAFAAAMRLEYGELDVIRDKATGLIYVIDANRTPTGPPRKLAAAAAQDAAARMAVPFARLLERRG
jgi:glutathione synthase/RimK-type ligase-like ATP-grasp enzyme